MLSTMTAPTKRDAILGDRVATLREGAGFSQGDVAGAMRKLGFRWGQSTLAQVETGRRALSLWEAAGLIGILNTREIAGAGGPVRLADLVPEVEAPDLDHWPLVERLQARRRLRANLDEWTQARERRWRAILGRPPEYPRQIGTDADGRPQFSTPPDPAPDWVDQQMLLDAEGKAALALSRSSGRPVPVEAVVLASWKLWQCSLTEKREQVLADHPGRSGDERRDQAIRGHATRRLLAELRPVLAPLRRRRKS